MKLVVGLGNPGEKYKNTRHNIGEMTLNLWAKNNFFPPFKFNKKLKSLISKTLFNNKEIILAFPQTFMNNSGSAVSQIIKYYKISSSDIWVIHDELDLPLGKIKISKNKSAAGHKGVQSIINFLKTKDFIRFRIGIGHPENKAQTWLSFPRSLGKAKTSFSLFSRSLENKQKPENFVLSKFTLKEKEILKEVIKKTFRAIEIALTKSLDKAMNLN